MQKIML